MIPEKNCPISFLPSLLQRLVAAAYIARITWLRLRTVVKYPRQSFTDKSSYVKKVVKYQVSGITKYVEDRIKKIHNFLYKVKGYNAYGEYQVSSHSPIPSQVCQVHCPCM